MPNSLVDSIASTDGGRELSREVAEHVTDDEIAAREARERSTERFDDCSCRDTEANLPCFACWREGFSTQNPAEPAAAEDGDTQ